MIIKNAFLTNMFKKMTLTLILHEEVETCHGHRRFAQCGASLSDILLLRKAPGKLVKDANLARHTDVLD